MNIETNKPCSEPKSLDLEEWVIFGLEDPAENSRILSLEEISSSGASDETLDRINQILAKDPSPTCQNISARILSQKASQAVEITPLDVSTLTPDFVKGLFDEPDYHPRLALIRSIRSSPPAFLLEGLRNCLFGENSQEVIEAGLSLLLRFGDPSDASIAATFLGSESPAILNSALGVIKKFNIELLKQALPGVLVSGDPIIRIHAIRYLRGIDPSEALLHLKSILFSKDVTLRQFALRELLLIPFQEAESLYLQYISAETAPLLLVISGLSIASNPHPSIPMKLFDIFLAARGIKQRILGLIVNQSVQCIKDSGILDEPIEAYLASLKGTLEERRTAHLVTLALRDIDHTDLEIRRNAVERLKNFSHLPKVSEAFSKRAFLETDDEIKTQLLSATGQQKIEDLPTLEKALADGIFPKLPLPQQHALLELIKNNETYRKNRDSLKKLLTKEIHNTILIEVLRKVSFFGDKSDSPQVIPFLKNSDHGIISAGIKTLGKLDPDALIPFLNSFLGHDNPYVKLAALEFYLGSDKEDAIQHLHAMLKSSQFSVRHQALGLIPLIDYVCAEPIIIGFFESETQLDLKKDAGFVIASNPTIEGFYSIYKQTHDEKNSIVKDLGELWELALLAAVPIISPDAKKLEEECLERISRENAARKAPPPEYSYQKIASKIQTSPKVSPKTLPEQPTTLLEQLWPFKWKFAVFALTAIPIFLFLFGEGSEQTGKSKSPQDLSTSSSSQGQGNAFKFRKSAQNPASGLRSGVDKILSGKSYENLLLAGMKERKESTAMLEERRKEYLRKLAENPNANVYVKLTAEAALDKNLNEGINFLRAMKSSDAKESFKKVVSDETASPLARVKAQQSLANIAMKDGNRAEFLKCVDGYMKDLGQIPGFEGMKKFDSTGDKFNQMTKTKEILQNFEKEGKLPAGEISEKFKQLVEMDNLMSVLKN